MMRTFPFSFASPGLFTGGYNIGYNPTPGDIILEAFFNITTAFNGTSPFLDAGTFHGGDSVHTGWWALAIGFGVDGTLTQHQEDSDYLSNAVGSSGTGAIPFLHGNPPLTAFSFTSVTPANPFEPTEEYFRFAPGIFNGSDPILIACSYDGSNIGSAPTQASAFADGPFTLPLTITGGTNDQFAYSALAGTTPEGPFTISPGTYTTDAQVIAAVAGAVNGSSVLFSHFVNVSTFTSHNLLLTASSDVGALGNLDTFGPVAGRDASVALGFTGNPDFFFGGQGGNPGSTQGAGSLYLLTLTP